MIIFEALEKAFESSPRVFETLMGRSAEITEGVHNLTSTVDRIHGLHEEQQVLGGQIVQLAQEQHPESVTPISAAAETAMAAQVDEVFTETEQQSVEEAQSRVDQAFAEMAMGTKIDQAFSEIYQHNPDLSLFDDELTTTSS